MEYEIVKGRDLIDLGWEPGPAIGHALAAANRKLAAGAAIEDLTKELLDVKADPDSYLEDRDWSEAASALLAANQKLTDGMVPQLRDEPAPLAVWGRELIDEQSFEQIANAARLPVTLRVALMPDAHVGYGLPIGGVAALEGAIAPYMVGVDIGCRMHATIFDRNPIHLAQQQQLYQQLLLDNTFFGRSATPPTRRTDHPILDDPRWSELPRHLRNLQQLAVKQLGSSGGGNHFVEWARLVIAADNPAGIEAGEYIALVSHSGSRGVGFKIAQHYSGIAEDVSHFLPKELRKLGYLDWQRGDGQEYEVAMNLAGDFARANHEVIHQRIRDALGGHVLATLQNHHNFAWRIDRDQRSPVFVHRKGATPAEKGVLGIIPGSMAAPGFFVEGLGDTPDKILQNRSLNSAAHGSGRRLGRRQAINKLDAAKVRAHLQAKGVTLLGGGLDEAPDAYKDSRAVIAAQQDLVRVWAEFHPQIVRMASDRGRSLGRHDPRQQGWRKQKRGRRR